MISEGNYPTLRKVLGAIEADKVYYHGRNERRPYGGHYIFITDSLEYASLYAGDKVRMYSVPFDQDKLFSIKNPSHVEILRPYLDKQSLEAIFRNSDGGEMDWAAVGYISNQSFDTEEDLIKHLGFLGMKLQERTGIESLYIFDEKNLKYLGETEMYHSKSHLEIS